MKDHLSFPTWEQISGKYSGKSRYLLTVTLERYGIECVRSCDQKPYLYNETKGGICIKIEFNPQKNISLLQDGRRSVCLLLQDGRRDVM